MHITGSRYTEPSVAGQQDGYCEKCSTKEYQVWHGGKCPDTNESLAREALAKNNIGWICPKCNTSNSPNITQCLCNSGISEYKIIWNKKWWYDYDYDIVTLNNTCKDTDITIT